ncbi:two-component system, OmpR family, response regulator RegX3 [Nocardioides alpinus]|uniref:DNA-binding response regulator n=1 Tax=Nocardioides alpinus TaxID=748909 RepID=A0A1I0ZH96_9ACTN|nr:response regulator transcription factor [Nocardioides alpinus]PKH40644.1 DNA-binding response regulator [Nocardioides alpinus]SFB23920.1 two-component system, OmpR family, response regulator RegX3 [Nocardioides alpinus]
MHVLVVEDDADVAAPLAHFFTARGYDAAVVAHGREALAHVERTVTDLVLLDLTLPDMDGLDVCGAMRGHGFDGGVIILSARSQEMDVVAGLDAGADDYLAKPCSIAELQARVGSVLRRIERSYVLPRPRRSVENFLEVRDHEVAYRGVQIATSGREYDVLAILLAHRDRVVTHDALMDEVWGSDWSGSPMVLSSAIGRIRERLAAAGAPDRIVNVRGIGFRLTSS